MSTTFPWKPRSIRLTIVVLFLLLMFSPDVYSSAAASFAAASSSSASSAASLADIRDQEFLKGVARTIFARTREQVRLKEKLSKHDETMIGAWKSGKKWGELAPSLQSHLTRHIPKSQVQSILRRERHSLMDKEVLAGPEKFAVEIIEKGIPALVPMGEKQDRYGLKISYDMKPKIAGITYTKKGMTIEEVTETKIYISFDITDIVQKVSKSGKDAWNKENDGEVTTLCVDE